MHFVDEKISRMKFSIDINKSVIDLQKLFKVYSVVQNEPLNPFGPYIPNLTLYFVYFSELFI